MNLSNIIIIFLCIVSVGFTQNTNITGTFTFKKRNPGVALLYFDQDKGLKVSNANLDQMNKAFVKPLLVVNPGSEVKFKNSDAVDHNIYASDKKQKVNFDVGLITTGGDTNYKVEWDKGKVVKLRCKIHPKMKSYIASIESEFHKVVPFEKREKELTFEMSSVPENLDSLVIWMPKYKELHVNLKPGESKTFELTRKGKVKGFLSLKRSVAIDEK
ncbi:MAG: hypothetical protein KC646_16870 [Candidatus Cloacimonetes bacterium]|nr:hypothetical protein [Candidatus Cloacimonadota bacterium]